MFPPSLRHLRMHNADSKAFAFRSPGGPLSLLRCPRLETLSLVNAHLAESWWAALFRGTSLHLFAARAITTPP